MSAARRPVAVLAAVILALPAVPAAVILVQTPAAAAPCSHVQGDFNGNGDADALVGQPFRTIETTSYTGAMNEIFGGSNGLTTSGNVYADETTFGQALHSGDELGEVHAVADFNGDCFADVAVSLIGGDDGLGAVAIFYGSATGLRVATPVIFTASQFGITAVGIGTSLAADDFNGDGYPDLALGAPYSNAHTGMVFTMPGSASGLSLTGAKFFTQDTPGVPGTAEIGDLFGYALAAGDFTGDGTADLAIGSPGESIGDIDQAGSVTVLDGSGSGLTSTGSQAFSENTSGVPGAAEIEDQWAGVLAAGDITGDGRADLIVGDPFEGVGSAKFAGTVTVLRGATAGVTASGSQGFTQNSAGVPGTAEFGDVFGNALAVGDFDGDGRADVAIGAPGEAIGTLTNAGTVDVLYGRSTGLTGTGAQAFSQDTTGILGAAEIGDSFGQSLQALRLTGGSRADLVVGVPNEDSGGFTDNGAIAVLLGGAHGLTATGNQFIDGTGLAGGAQDQAFLSLGVPG